jgi:AraC-like DNA-binding protein
VQELRDAILRHATEPVTQTAIPGLTLYCSDERRSGSIPFFYKPMVCVMAQGEKSIAFGGRTFRYASTHYLLSSVDLPLRGSVFRAAPGRPYLSASLSLDMVMLSDLFERMSPRREPKSPAPGLAVGRLSEELLDAFTRLASLLDMPQDIDVLAPLIQREIFYRLLCGEHGSMLRQICLNYGGRARISEAIRWIREHFHEPFSAKKLAQRIHMSEAALNRNFRALTGISPLQYQKQVRLQEARRMLLSSGDNAATAAFRVGYSSASQFSREYRRTFGVAPMADVHRSHRLFENPIF